MRTKLAIFLFRLADLCENAAVRAMPFDLAKWEVALWREVARGEEPK